MFQTDFAPQRRLAKSPLRPPASPHQPKPPEAPPPALLRYPLGSLLVCACLCLLGVGIYMWPRVQGVRLAYHIQGAEQRVKGLIQERDQLRLERAALSDPQRLYHEATEQLGLVTPNHDQVFILVHESKRP